MMILQINHKWILKDQKYFTTKLILADMVGLDLVSEVEQQIFQAFLRSLVESLAHQKSQLRKYQVEGRKVMMTELTL